MLLPDTRSYGLQDTYKIIAVSSFALGCLIAGRLSARIGIAHRGWLAGSFLIQAIATAAASALLHFTNAEIDNPGSPFAALPGNIAFGLLAGSMAWQACNAKPLGTAYQSTVVLTMVRSPDRALS